MRVLRTLAAYTVSTICFLAIAYQALAQDTPASLSDQDEAASYLSAFKQRAIDAAFDSGARVKGVAYIDDKGRLHERTMFSSEADVRGVQIDSYLEAMGGEASLDAVQVSEDARCQLWTGKGSNSGLVAIRLTSGQVSETSKSAQLTFGATGPIISREFGTVDK